MIQGASELGIPISTTHAITSSVVGVGVARRISAVRWGIGFNIVLSWVLTLPITMAFGAGAVLVLRSVGFLLAR